MANYHWMGMPIKEDKNLPIRVPCIAWSEYCPMTPEKFNDANEWLADRFGYKVPIYFKDKCMYMNPRVVYHIGAQLQANPNKYGLHIFRDVGKP